MQRSLSFLLLCGLVNSARAAPIVGGVTSKAGAWPDVVAVLGPNGACSGTLIAPDVVLTAGHCVEIDPQVIIANTLDYNAPSAGETIRVKWARAYPDWETRYDVAVLMLDHVAKPRPRAIATGCLANRALGAGKPVTVIGFGLTSPTGTDDNTVLHQATLPILDPTCGTDPVCEPSIRPNGEFAAGGRGTDSCMGDSGGPAMLDAAAGPALVGVVSRGLALPGVPCGNGGVYVRADKVVAWIERITDRKLVRAACDGQADDPELQPVEDGGCAAAGGAELGVGLLLIAGVRRRRATRVTGDRPDRGEPLVRTAARAEGVADADRAAGDHGSAAADAAGAARGLALDPGRRGGARGG